MAVTFSRMGDASVSGLFNGSLLSLTTEISPIIGIRIALRFGCATAPGLFHQPALTAMLRTLMQGELTNEPLLWVQATEGGRAFYERGEAYRFNVFAARPAHALLMRLIERLPKLQRHLPDDKKVPFGANLTFAGFHHPVDDSPLRPGRPVAVFDGNHLQAEYERFCTARRLRVRLLSPLRVLRDKAERGDARGDARYVHDARHLQSLLFRRVRDTLLAVAKRVDVSFPRLENEPEACALDVFHVDWDYRDSKGRAQNMAGMLGWLEYDQNALQPQDLLALLLAQRLGIGQRRTFGWGALRVETTEGQGVVPPRRAQRDLLLRAAAHENLREAFRDSAASGDTPRQWQRLPKRSLPQDALAWLHELHEPLSNGDYSPPPSVGRVLMQADGKLRPLAVPPWGDRLVQRAVARVLTAELETIFNPTSFGYRRGHSRHQIRDRIGSLYRAGYKYCFEADISGFFDHVSHHRIETRLIGLLGDDPAIAPIMRWLALPVEFKGHKIQRACGLPQGSPLSPTLANMLLEDLDADCQAHGLQLLRYADDFVVLCRSEQEAQQAWQRAEITVDELGLRLKPAKTGIQRLGDGNMMEFLGFRFIGDLSIQRTKPAAKPSTTIQIPPTSWLADLIAQHPTVADELQQEWNKRYTPGRPSKLNPTRRSLPAGEPTEPPLSRKSLLAGEPTDARIHEPTNSRTSTLLQSQEQQKSNPDRRSLLAGEQALETLATSGIPTAHFGEGSLLCITEPALLAQRQGQLLVLTDSEGGQQYPWSELGSVLVFGVARLTSGVVAGALAHGVPIHFLGGTDGYLGRLVADHFHVDDLDAALLQRERFSDQALRLALSRRLVEARLHNQREVLRQRLRDHADRDQYLKSIGDLIGKLDGAERVETLNGLEGNAARLYFQAIGATLPEWAGFETRNRRPPRDPFNALLSLGFTIMYSRTIGMIHACGFHPRIGFYHKPHGRHAVLSSDLMEPFRHLVERTACTVLIRGELKADDFSMDPDRGCRLGRSALKRYLQRLAEAFARPMSPLDGDKGNYYQLMQRQLTSLDRLRRGEEPFTPWFFRTK